MEPGFQILLEEGPCLVVNKPAGVLTQAPAGIDSLEHRIRAFLASRDGREGFVYLGVPHRLDRPVSGAIVFAKNRRAAQRLTEQFHDRLVRKVYWACLAGAVSPGEGTWTDYMRKVPDEPRAELTAENHPEARQAVLHYRTLATGSRSTLVEIELDTGRMHQIRLQAASRGHAVLGDAQYGSTEPFGPAMDDARLQPIALHSRLLSFRHPTLRTPVLVEAPLPAVWRDLHFDSLDSYFQANE